MWVGDQRRHHFPRAASRAMSYLLRKRSMIPPVARCARMSRSIALSMYICVDSIKMNALSGNQAGALRGAYGKCRDRGRLQGEEVCTAANAPGVSPNSARPPPETPHRFGISFFSTDKSRIRHINLLDEGSNST
jgi:hypothetical protein